MFRLSLSILASALIVATACAPVPVDGSAPAAAPASASGAARFAGIPNLSFAYYDVSGRTPQEIRRSIEAQRPHDPNAGKRVDALTTWAMDWNIPGGPGGCDLKRAEVVYRARVTLPRLADRSSLSPSQAARWHAYRDWLEQHEAWHARHAWEHVDEVRAAIRASSCARAAAAAAAAIHAVAEEQRRYDIATRHGATDGVSFP